MPKRRIARPKPERARLTLPVLCDRLRAHQFWLKDGPARCDRAAERLDLRNTDIRLALAEAASVTKRECRAARRLWQQQCRQERR